MFVLLYIDLVCHTLSDLRSKEEVVRALRTSLASKQVWSEIEKL